MVCVSILKQTLKLFSTLTKTHIYVQVYTHMYIFHTFSIGYADLDKLLDLDQAMIQIRSVKHRWRELAEAMRLPETALELVGM